MLKENWIKLTLRGEPLMSTLSANLTLLGLDFSLAFLAADNRADLRLELWGHKIMTLVSDNCVNNILLTFLSTISFRYHQGLLILIQTFLSCPTKEFFKLIFMLIVNMMDGSTETSDYI